MKRVVFITGASRGIGLELVRQYAVEGARVLATCRKPAEATALLELAERHGSVEVHALDVADGRSIAKMGAKLAGQPIDVVVNNAGGSDRRRTLSEVSWEGFAATMRVNAFATLEIAQALVDNVAESKLRTFVTITSQMGSIGENDSGGRYSYRASKAAANMIVRTLSIDLADRGILAIAVHPGWVKTDMGGPGATLSVDESVRALRGLIGNLRKKDSGRFFDIRGREIPW